MAILRISNVSKFFEKEKPPIIHDASYTFEHTRSVALMGVSGTGKSTFIHMLAGLDAPSSGSIFFDDADMYALDGYGLQHILGSKLGLILQSPHLIQELSVIENVMLKELIKGQVYKEIFGLALELLETVGLGDKMHALPGQLSGGEQQRVSIARALLTKPIFILADEPTAHLDAHAKKNVIELLLSYHRRQGAGLLIATHDDFVAQQMDVVLRLESGKLRQIISCSNNPLERLYQPSAA